MNHLRAGYQQHGRFRILLDDFLSQQQRAANIAESKRVVRVEKNSRIR